MMKRTGLFLACLVSMLLLPAVSCSGNTQGTHESGAADEQSSAHAENREDDAVQDGAGAQADAGGEQDGAGAHADAGGENGAGAQADADGENGAGVQADDTDRAAEEAAGLQMYDAYAKGDASGGSGNAGGYYEILFHSEGDSNILYTDIATKQRIYLSADLSSDHRSPADTSWLEETPGGAFVFAGADRLFIRTTGIDDTPGVLYQAELSGANREKLLSFDQWMPMTDAVAGDGQYLYTLMSDDDGTVQIIRIDTVGGTAEEIAAMPEQTAFLMSAFDSNLVLKTISSPEEGAYEDALEQYKNSEQIVYTFDVNTKELKEVIRWKQDLMMEVLKDQMLYLLDVNKDSLYSIDLRDNSRTEIISSMTEKQMPADEISGLNSVIDGHIIFGVKGADTGYIDLKTKTVAVQDILEESYKQSAPYILGESGDYFLVVTDMLEIPYDDFAPDGVTPIVNTMLIPNYGLILKEDYWNSDYQYEEIRNTFLDNGL